MTNLDYYVLPWYQKFFVKIGMFFAAIGKGIAHFICSIPGAIAGFFKMIGRGFAWYGKTFVKGSIGTKLSYIVMGLGNIFHGQFIKGLIFLAAEAGYIWFMINSGWTNILKLQNLGTTPRTEFFDEVYGIYRYPKEGEYDNSMLVLLYGVFTIIITIALIIMYVENIKSSAYADECKSIGHKPPKFIDDIKNLLDGSFHKTLLFLPIIGILIFTITPLIYMISLAFTNYDANHQVPGNLFTWIGLSNFGKLMNSNLPLGKTFWNLLVWTIVWAVFATFLNYIGGVILALGINRKGVPCKGLIRTLFVMSIAVPQFVSLLVMRNLLAAHGPINETLLSLGWIRSALPFFTDPVWAKVTVILVNLWVGIPYTMLMVSGILMNIPEDLYEAGRIDGASPVVMFTQITMPYILHVTTPYLITQFTGNINNFNVIYFLSGGGPETLEYYQAGKTDLLITWLYKLTVSSRDYNYAATIGIMVFVILAIVSLVTFRNSGSYKNEEAFQ